MEDSLTHIEWHAVQGKRSLTTLLVKKGESETPLHSRIDPGKEKNLLHDINPAREDYIIVVGAGLLYGLFNAMDIIESVSRLLIIDVLPGLRSEVVRNSDAVSILDLPSVVYMDGATADSVSAFLKEDLQLEDQKGLRVVTHPASMRILNDEYSPILSAIAELIDAKSNSHVTKKRFGRLFSRNVIEKIIHAKRFLPLDNFKNSASGATALVISAGPSVDSRIDAIQELARGSLIIAVDSAVTMLRAYGITPDIVVSVDPQFYAREHLLSESLSYFHFVAMSASSEVSEKGNTILYPDTHPLSQMVAETAGLGQWPLKNGTGMVAGDSVALAFYLGCKRVVLAGNDFSFPHHEIYARSSTYQNRYREYFHNRINSVEQQNMTYIRGGGKLLQYEGVPTRKNFLGYHSSFKEYIEISMNNGRTVYSLRGQGLNLNVPEPLVSEIYSEEAKKKALREIGKIAESSNTIGDLLDIKAVVSMCNRHDIREELNSMICGSDDRCRMSLHRLLEKLEVGV